MLDEINSTPPAESDSAAVVSALFREVLNAMGHRWSRGARDDRRELMVGFGIQSSSGPGDPFVDCFGGLWVQGL